MSFRTAGLVGGGVPSFLIAASDAPTRVKNGADYVCDGVADQVEFMAAINASQNIPGTGGVSGSVGGGVAFSEGNYYFSAKVSATLFNLTLCGAGGHYGQGGSSPAQPQTGGSVIHVTSSFPDSYVFDFRASNPATRSLVGLWLAGFAIDGYDGTATYAPTSGMYLQAFKSWVWDLSISRLQTDGIYVDGNDATVTYPLGAWDNIFSGLRFTDIGRDMLSFQNGASDCIVSNSKFCGEASGARGRYAVFADSSPGLQLIGNHFYLTKDYAVHANARQFQATGNRFSDCFGGCIYVDGTAAQGAGFNIEGVMMRDVNRSAGATVDAIHIEPTGSVRGGSVKGVTLLTTNNSYRPRYVINVASANAVNIDVDEPSAEYLSPATRAVTTGLVNAQVTTKRHPWVLAQANAGASHTGDTNEFTFATITVPGDAIGPNGRLRIRTEWSITNNANAKTLRARFSGAAGTIFLQASAASVAVYNASMEICNRNATNSQFGLPFSGIYGSGGSATATAAVDTTADTTVVITGQLGNGGDTVTLEGYCVEVIPG